MANRNGAAHPPVGILKIRATTRPTTRLGKLVRRGVAALPNQHREPIQRVCKDTWKLRRPEQEASTGARHRSSDRNQFDVAQGRPLVRANVRRCSVREQRPAGTSITSDDVSLRATRIANASRVKSSNTQSIRNFRPSRIRCSTKSSAQTWFARFGGSRMHGPPGSHNLPRFGCRCSTFSASRRQVRSTSFRFTAQPASLNNAVIRR